MTPPGRSTQECWFHAKAAGCPPWFNQKPRGKPDRHFKQIVCCCKRLSGISQELAAACWVEAKSSIGFARGTPPTAPGPAFQTLSIRLFPARPGLFFFRMEPARRRFLSPACVFGTSRFSRDSFPFASLAPSESTFSAFGFPGLVHFW